MSIDLNQGQFILQSNIKDSNQRQRPTITYR